MIHLLIYNLLEFEKDIKKNICVITLNIIIYLKAGPY